MCSAVPYDPSLYGPCLHCNLTWGQCTADSIPCCDDCEHVYADGRGVSRCASI